MMNTTCMIELKKEYTILLCQILTPIILEGLQHLYNEAKKSSNKNNVLKTFQLLLKSIPSWDADIVRKEIERINLKTKEQSWFMQLIQVIFRLNVLINDLEPSEVLKKELDMSLFIHTIYIECARQFWMDPFLFYHEYSSLEQKKNYCDIMKTIEYCIQNAIRRLLPLNAIFENLLGPGTLMANGKELDLFDNYNMPLLLDIPIEKEKKPDMPQIEPSAISGGADNQQIHDIMEPVPAIITMMPSAQNNNMIGGNETNENNINEKILNIINKNSILSDSNDNNNFTINNHSAHDNIIMPQMQPNMMAPQMQQMQQMPQMQLMQPNMMMPQMQQMPQMQNNMMMPQMQQMLPMKARVQNKHHSDRNSSSTLKRIVHESIRQTQNTATKSNNSEIKNKILKDLDSDTVTYNPEENAENYQDIFSNSDMKHTVNTHEKNEKKSREKFFNNYLNI